MARFFRSRGMYEAKLADIQGQPSAYVMHGSGLVRRACRSLSSTPLVLTDEDGCARTALVGALLTTLTPPWPDARQLNSYFLPLLAQHHVRSNHHNVPYSSFMY